MFRISDTNLPGYQHWSKDLFRKLVEEEGIEFEVDSKYYFKPSMLVLYEFTAKPLFGKYKCGFLDRVRGVVLSERSTQQMLEYFSRHVLIGNLELQRVIDQDLKIKTHHMISFGQTGYMSLTGHRRVDSDWVALHNINDYKLTDNKVVFKTGKIAGRYLKFEFNCNSGFQQIIDESILHNSVIYELTLHYMVNIIGWNIGKPYRNRSILFKRMKPSLEKRKPNYCIHELSERIFRERFNWYMENFAREFDFKAFALMDSAHIIYRISTRKLHHY